MISTIFAKQTFQFICGENAGLPPFHFPITKNNKRRHAPDAKFGSRPRVLVHIYLDDGGLTSHTPFQLFQYGSLRFPRAAPFGKKVDQYRFVLIEDRKSVV